VKRHFRIQAQILDDFNQVIFKINITPLDKGTKEIMDFINNKIK